MPRLHTACEAQHCKLALCSYDIYQLCKEIKIKSKQASIESKVESWTFRN